MPSEPRSFEDIKATVTAIVAQCPGIEPLRLAARSGLPIVTQNKTSRRNASKRLSASAQKALDRLLAEGLIRIEPPSIAYPKARIFPPAYQPQQPSSAYQTPCTVSFAPNLKGAWQPGDQPVRGRAANIPAAVNWRETKPLPLPTQENPPMDDVQHSPAPIANGDLRAAIEQRSARAASMKATLAPQREAREAQILAAIAQLEASGEPFSQRQAEETAWGKATGYIAKNAVALAAFRAALARINSSQESAVSGQPELPPLPSPLSPLPTHPPSPDPYQLRLEEDNARLRAEIEALRAQKQQATTPDRDLLQALKDEEQLVQIETLKRQHDRLLNEADAMQRLIEQREATLERVEQTEAVLAETNGHKALAGVTR